MGFRCLCPTVFVSVVGGEKNNTPKGGKKKIEFVLRWGRHTLLPSFGLCVGFPKGRDRMCDLAMCVTAAVVSEFPFGF